MSNVFLFGLAAIYFIYTLLYAIKFNRSDIYYSKGRRIFHNIMIWVIPFLWISLLKSIEKPVPGSYEFEEKKDPDGFSNNVGNYGGGGSNIPWT